MTYISLFSDYANYHYMFICLFVQITRGYLTVTKWWSCHLTTIAFSLDILVNLEVSIIAI